MHQPYAVEETARRHVEDLRAAAERARLRRAARATASVGGLRAALGLGLVNAGSHLLHRPAAEQVEQWTMGALHGAPRGR